MSSKTQDAEFRHPEAVAFLESLTSEQAAKQPLLILEQDGVVARQRLEDGHVRCREFETDGASGVRFFEMDPLHSAAEAEFGRSLPRLEAEFRVGGVPDLDAIETSVRERALGLGAKTYADLLEARDAADPPSPCPSCGRRTERHSRAAKTFRTRLGPVRVERIQCRCRDCRCGFRQLDRTLGLEGKTVTPGAESLYADAASSDSYEEAGRKLKNLAGVDVPASTLQRHVMGIGEEMQAFEREDTEAEAPASKRVLVGIDGTGVPPAAREVEGAAGKQADGTAKTSEAKVVVCFTADGRDPKTGEPRRKDKGGGADGVSRASDFAARLEQFGYRNALFKAEELVVLSDGAPWIRTTCEEILVGPDMTFILDLFHALEKAADAVRDVTPDKSERTACMDWIREQLNAGQVAQVIAILEPHRRRSEAVAAASATAKPTRTECVAISIGRADCRSDPVSWKAPASTSSATDSKRRDVAGRKPAPTLCSPSDAASKTCGGPTSSNGELVAPQPPNQRKWDAPYGQLRTTLIDGHKI